jgi:two-component system, chemotaxis family, sensor kinase CheA
MDEIVKDFLIESNENLDRLDQELVKLESEPSSKELLASIFRTIHTIKGSCGFLGFAHLEKVGARGRKFALAAARWKTRPERAGHERIAGHGRCRAL